MSSRRPAAPGSAGPGLPLGGRLAAAAVAAVLLAAGCSAGGDRAEHASGEQEDTRPRPEGEPDELTEVDPAVVLDLGEERTAKDDRVRVEVSYPTVPNADPFNERLGEITGQEVDDFAAANPGARSISISGALTAAADDVVGVRFTQEEKDSEDPRTGYATFWYDALSGRTAFSTELLAGHEQLVALNGLVRDALKGRDEVAGAAIQPVLRVYDSMGFNPDGDLVVEFDAGQVAPAAAGRIAAVVPREQADPLLSEFGRRARAAATVVDSGFTLGAPPAPEDIPAPEAVPGVFPVTDDSVDCSAPEAKCIALTFDDGPGGRTAELLDVLRDNEVRATFFLTGGPIREYAPLVRREYAEGHELANHTVTHPDLAGTSPDRIAQELRTVNALIRRETGYQPDLMRPPYGSTNDGVRAISGEHGLAEILWSVDTNDWRDRNARIVADRAVKHARPGSIILMHDIHSTTIDAVPDIIRRLREKGYTLVTVSQLLGGTEPGQSYRHAHPEEPAADPSAAPSPSASESAGD
ncbi:polysaccharide deacetylase family protein [Marinitenerispora sediminis]|uniref:Polysaccharide deacetylase n=1 Tax=Marinitenerispora sediminis TaxID=1931232 RepID=A0A368T0Z6_9ACTN|nr:polysaccharide deacetylase family protein [Marinitenerispora sediminis]RCV50232.1 polysaccharide deacetylase [Marinitenerispora sediminis]RCV53503.1 polysaccharide deacetylase [Marinitenerispora sediminis]RCV54570.1 polysaccharide deacetylase [Marinitenerispora sediminis]